MVEISAEKFNINPTLPDFPRLNLKILHQCFTLGKFITNTVSLYDHRLAIVDYHGKYFYNKIPRCMKYTTSESVFEAMKF